MHAYSLGIILLAPLLAGIGLGLFARGAGVKVGRIGVAAEVVALLFSLQLLWEVTTAGSITFHVLPESSRPLGFIFHLDRLAAVMLVHIAAISILIHSFSIRYMQQERGYARFHSLLAFTTFALFGMVTSANLLMLLIFWQLLSWLLPLLSYNYQHPPTVTGAFRTFVMQRTGDVAFLAAVIVAYRWYGTLDLPQLFERAAAAGATTALWPGGPELGVATAVALLIFVGAMAKSAQFPLHMWLPDSLYAPTPVHALLHAGIINAGGFLLARLAPLYGLSPATLHLVFAVGLLTTLLGSSMMLVQSDIKKTLGYSTIGQMGFMIMECGLGAYGLAIFHLIAHGLFKGSIFLGCGQVIHSARQEPRLPVKNTAAVNAPQFSPLAWFTGLITTLILPLILVLVAHGVVNIPLGDSQGATIFLFFGWATSSQAILTLYRLRAVASWKVAASMLGALFLVVVTYLLAAESFTHFLFPGPGEVARHFQAGALPVPLFDALIGAFALVIIVGWFLIYARSHGRTIRTPLWLDRLQVRLYLFLLNRLYLDALSGRLKRRLTASIARFDSSRRFTLAAGAIALGAAFAAAGDAGVPLAEIALLAILAFFLPLFPLHAVYVAALTRAPGRWPAVLSVLLPAAGLCGLEVFLPHLAAGSVRAASAMAAIGALYGSFKALAATKAPEILAYGGVAFFAALWWDLAGAASLRVEAIVYGAATILLIALLLWTWHHVQRRCGDLTLDKLHGLAQPMPRFATIMALLIMAAVGLPPFGLFFAFVTLLLQSDGTSSPPGWIAILIAWFAASWYLFRMMQRLLFGPHRSDFRYRDLHGAEVAGLACLIAILVLLGAVPFYPVGSELLFNGPRLTLETIP